MGRQSVLSLDLTTPYPEEGLVENRGTPPPQGQQPPPNMLEPQL